MTYSDTHNAEQQARIHLNHPNTCKARRCRMASGMCRGTLGTPQDAEWQPLSRGRRGTRS